MRFTSRVSEASTGCCRRKLRLRFADFFPSRWAFGAFRRRSFPVPVTLNRFFAPLCLFCFGIFFGDSCVLRRAEHHDHVPSVEERRRLDEPDLLDVLGETHQQVPSPLRVSRLAAPQHDLDLRPLVEEADDMALLRLVVVNSDLWPELDLLDVDRNLVLASELGLLLLLVAVLAVVHDPRDRRIGLSRDLDEVEVLAVRVVERLLDRLHSELAALFVDETDLRRADVLVDPAVWDDWPGGFDPTSWPQRRFTKLSASSFSKRQNRCATAASSLPTFSVEPPTGSGPRR